MRLFPEKLPEPVDDASMPLTILDVRRLRNDPRVSDPLMRLGVERAIGNFTAALRSNKGFVATSICCGLVIADLRVGDGKAGGRDVEYPDNGGIRVNAKPFCVGKNDLVVADTGCINIKYTGCRVGDAGAAPAICSGHAAGNGCFQVDHR